MYYYLFIAIILPGSFFVTVVEGLFAEVIFTYCLYDEIFFYINFHLQINIVMICVDVFFSVNLHEILMILFLHLFIKITYICLFCRAVW